jgi:CRP/FNR family transcriptional regulator, cyclic AMP receptor protein
MHGDPVRTPSHRTTPINALCPKCGRASKRVATLRGHVDNREYEMFRCLACGFVLSSKVKGATFWAELRDRDNGEACPEAEVRMGLKPENIHLLSDLPGRLSIELFASATLVRLAAGNTLFLAGDSDDDCYRIEGGLLKVTMVSHSGDERILAFVGRGDIVGELSIIDGLPRSASVVAVRDATLSCLSRTAFETFAEKHPELYKSLVGLLAKRLRETNTVVAAGSFLSLKGRVARTMLELAEHFGQEVGSGRIEIRQKISQNDLAAMAGVARENVTRILNDWQREKLVTCMSRGYYCLENKAQLEHKVKL